MSDYNSVKWEDIVCYDESSPSGLIWKVDISNNISNRIIVRKGSFSGNKTTHGYFTVTYNGVGYKAHRVVWILHNGIIDNTKCIDHIDGNRANNKISNLRLVSARENCHNMKKGRNNSSGVMGVNFQRNKVGNTYWVAQWRCFITGKHKAKSFSILKYGDDLAFKLACDYRVEMLEKQNLLGASYTDLHIFGK